jgi:hypothetical protein
VISMLSVYPLMNFWIDEPIFRKLDIYIMAPEPVSVAYFINPTHQSGSICVSPCRC